MGAYSPAPVVTPQIHSKIMREIIEPTVKGMEKEGIPFTGFLYAGVMIDKNGQPKTLEFNCRMGDPETQPIMARLKTDLVEIFKASFTQELDKIDVEWDRRFAVGVVLAAHNYPDTPRADDIIHGANVVYEDTDASSTFVFHAGTKYVEQEQKLYTCGGRVLCVVGLSDTIKHAKKQTYEMLESIQFDGMQFRSDIGYRAIKN
jgi:phosphoribosylamine---glycine ligase